MQSMGASIASGAVAGICYWLSCYPIDVIKNRLQVCACVCVCVCAREVYWQQGGPLHGASRRVLSIEPVGRGRPVDFQRTACISPLIASPADPDPYVLTGAAS